MIRALHGLLLLLLSEWSSGSDRLVPSLSVCSLRFASMLQPDTADSSHRSHHMSTPPPSVDPLPFPFAFLCSIDQSASSWVARFGVIEHCGKGTCSDSTIMKKENVNVCNHAIIRIKCGKSMNGSEEQEQESSKSRQEESALVVARSRLIIRAP